MENKNMKSNAFYMSMNSCFWKKKLFPMFQWHHDSQMSLRLKNLINNEIVNARSLLKLSKILNNMQATKKKKNTFEKNI
jgi:hypothetical protein